MGTRSSTCSWPLAFSAELTKAPHVDTLALALAKPLLEALERDSASGRVVEHASPAELVSAFEERGVPLLLGDEPAQGTTLAEAMRLTLAHSVHTRHPRFFNQNFAGADEVGVVADWLATFLNTTAATYEAAPVFTLMERTCLRALLEKAGFTDGEGLFCSGGSLANLLALHLARHRAEPRWTEEGPSGQRYGIFASAQAHYSLDKSAALLGLGRQALRKVSCLPGGSMDVSALRVAMDAAVKEGVKPLAVVATAGTTVLGAFDSIGPLADVCKEQGIWLHVDGCFGGSALMSRQHRALLRDIERADSLSWNLHKMLGMPQQCSTLLLREPGLRALSGGADYLFQPDKLNTDMDSGDAHFQCARRPDACKLWFSWKARGASGFEARIDHAYQLARYVEARVDHLDAFRSVAPSGPFNVCFWWVPRPPADANDTGTVAAQPSRASLSGACNQSGSTARRFDAAVVPAAGHASQLLSLAVHESRGDDFRHRHCSRAHRRGRTEPIGP